MGKTKKKKVKPGKIELDPADTAIIVNFETQWVEVAENGSQSVIDRSNGKKKIKLKGFNSTSDIDKYAQGIVSKCKYIHPSKQPHVHSLLQQLKDRIQSHKQSSMHANSESNPESKEKEEMLRLKEELENERNLRIKRESQLIEIKNFQEQQEKERVEKQKEEEERLRLQREEELRKQKEREEEEARVKAEEEKQRHRKEEERKLKEERKRQKKLRKKLLKQQMKIEKEMKKNVPKQTANMDKLDTYMEELYEDDISKKIGATYLILQLVQNAENLEHFIDNKALLGALSRILQEDRKKNIELITNILEIFFCFSNFTQLHPILVNSKIGATSMQIISHETKRYEIAVNDPKQKEMIANMEQRLNSNSQNDITLDDTEMRFILFLHRQEKILYVSFYILLNLAEDLEVETKMVKLDIVKYLMRTLRRLNLFRSWLDELFILVLTFLKKLSLFSENKTKMVELGIMEILAHIISSTEREDLELAVLRLLFNLSFSTEIKNQISERGMLPWLIECLNKEATQEYSVKILYNLSVMPEHRSTISYTDAVPILFELCMECADRLIPDVYIALAINLATSSRVVEHIIDEDYVPSLIKRVHRTFDPLLMKLIKNLSSVKNEQLMTQFQKFMHELVGMTKRCETEEFLVEVLGTLANMTFSPLQVRYSEIMSQYSLLEFFSKCLMPNTYENDIILNVIVIIGAFVCDEASSQSFADVSFIVLLLDTILERIEDEEIALQGIYTIFRLLLHEPTKSILVINPQFLEIVQQLLTDKNSRIKQWSELCLDIILEGSEEEWIESIRETRFEHMNSEWVEFIQSITSETAQHFIPMSPTELLNASNDPSMRQSFVMKENMHFMSEFSDEEDNDTYTVDDTQDFAA